MFGGGCSLLACPVERNSPDPKPVLANSDAKGLRLHLDVLQPQVPEFASASGRLAEISETQNATFHSSGCWRRRTVDAKTSGTDGEVGPPPAPSLVYRQALCLWGRSLRSGGKQVSMECFLLASRVNKSSQARQRRQSPSSTMKTLPALSVPSTKQFLLRQQPFPGLSR